jgi:trk system potassium uptake protein TrkA
VKIVVAGAGHVGTTIVESLHHEHELMVIDLDEGRLRALAHRFDVKTFQGNAASRRVLDEAGVRRAQLFIACTSRDETNLVAAILGRRVARDATTIVRTTNVEYIEVWRERQLDVDFLVSSELEAAHAVSRSIGVPAARQTDVFADGQVQVVEFDVEADHGRPDVIGPPLREAKIPADSRVVGIIRGGELRLPRGEASIEVGDRIVVIGSPRAAREWSTIIGPEDRSVRELAVFGAGPIGVAIAELLLDQGIVVRLIEADRERAHEVAEAVPRARVYHATGLDPDFLERERIGRAQAAVFAMGDDAKNHYGAALVSLHGIGLTIAIVEHPASVDVFEHGGVDVAIDPRALTAEEIVRFARDPRTRQVVMLEGDRFEILDIVVRPESRNVGKPFRELPSTGLVIGAVIRDGRAIFPHGDDMLQPGDRAIIFTPSSRVDEVEQGL